MSDMSFSAATEALFRQYQPVHEKVLREDSYIYFYIVLPPLWFEERLVKGIMYTNRLCDPLIENIPAIKDYFHVIASSFWCDYPTAARADAYFTLYPNPERDRWFRKNYPHCADKMLIPLQGADYVNEYQFMPVPTAKDIEVVCVSRMHPLKNLPVIAQALKIYRQKYHAPCRMALLPTGGKPQDFNCQDRSAWSEREQEILREMEAILEDFDDYIELLPWQCSIQGTLQKQYSRARLTVMGALVEGKNKSIYESMSCNTPVVVFQQFNEGIRGEVPLIPEGCGLYAPEVTPESLADTFHQVLKNPDDFEPRKNFLKHYGRKRFIQMCMDAFPYYGEVVPGYAEGSVFENPWLNLAMFNQWGTNLAGFVYREQKHYAYRMPDIRALMDFTPQTSAQHLKSFFH